MSTVKEIEEFTEKYTNFHEELIDFKKSIDVSTEKDTELFNSMMSYLTALKQDTLNKESKKQ